MAYFRFSISSIYRRSRSSSSTTSLCLSMNCTRFSSSVLFTGLLTKSSVPALTAVNKTGSLPDEKLLADEIVKTQQALGARRLG